MQTMKIRRKGKSDVQLKQSIHTTFLRSIQDSESYAQLNLIWTTFTSKIDETTHCQLFASYLKSFLRVPKHTVKTILPQLLIQVKYAIPRDETHYHIPSFNMFHPIELDVSLKTIVSYLEATDQLALLKDLPQSTIYTKLADELNVNNCSIYNQLSVYKAEMAKFKEANYFNPPLNFAELKNYLVKHSTDNVYASVLNTQKEYKIYQSILKHSTRKLPPSPPITEFNGITFNDEQRQCIQASILHPVSLISGSAGTGKTTLSMALASLLMKRGENVTFLTITSKARDVIRSKLSDMCVLAEAMTVSKYLCNPYKKAVDNIIVDEASMIGNSQLVTLLYSFRQRLILMGDAKQVLPVKHRF